MSFDFEDGFGLDSQVGVEQEDDRAFTEADEAVDFYTESDFRARGVDPVSPTCAKPGSEAKVLTLAARYAAGLPLWHDRDCYDHGPNAERRG